jgi:hypothetical protein
VVANLNPPDTLQGWAIVSPLTLGSAMQMQALHDLLYPQTMCPEPFHMPNPGGFDFRLLHRLGFQMCHQVIHPSVAYVVLECGLICYLSSSIRTHFSCVHDVTLIIDPNVYCRGVNAVCGTLIPHENSSFEVRYQNIRSVHVFM